MDINNSGTELIKAGLFAQFSQMLQSRFLGNASNLLVIEGPSFEECEKVGREYMSDLANPVPSITICKVEPGITKARIIKYSKKESRNG